MSCSRWASSTSWSTSGDTGRGLEGVVGHRRSGVTHAHEANGTRANRQRHISAAGCRLYSLESRRRRARGCESWYTANRRSLETSVYTWVVLIDA